MIDLERARLLADMFRLPFEFAVPDLLYDRELAGELGDKLVGLGLRVEVLTPVELSSATTVRRQNARLSVPDTFAFAIAQSRQWTLLTGDGTLRELATAERIDMHGVLWLFDQFADGNHVAINRLHDGLNTLFAHPRCRLPVQEVGRRLARFAEQIREG
nr:PIN domain-containing protein [Bradyrhizobium uaiense]